MFLQNGPRFFFRSLRPILPSTVLPGATHAPINVSRFGLFLGHILSGMFLGKEIFTGTYRFDYLDRQHLVINVNPRHSPFHHFGHFGIHEELSERKGHAQLQHTQTVNQVGPS